MNKGIHTTHAVEALLRTRGVLAASNAVQFGVVGVLLGGVISALFVETKTGDLFIEALAALALIINRAVVSRTARRIWKEMEAKAEPTTPPYNQPHPSAERGDVIQ